MAYRHELTEFGKTIKIRLLELQRTQKWLIAELNRLNVLKVDSSFLNKVMTGQVKKSRMEELICEVLSIQRENNKAEI
jgi:uncharacterized membrane protein YcaP (DUF421 family)